MLDINTTSITPGTLPNGYREVLYYRLNKPIRIIVLQILSIPVFAITEFAIVKKSSPTQRQKWLAIAQKLGEAYT